MLRVLSAMCFSFGTPFRVEDCYFLLLEKVTKESPGRPNCARKSGRPGPPPAIVLSTGGKGYTPINAFAGASRNGHALCFGYTTGRWAPTQLQKEPAVVGVGLFAAGEAAWGGGGRWCSLLCSLGEGAKFRCLRRGATVFAP